MWLLQPRELGTLKEFNNQTQSWMKEGDDVAMLICYVAMSC